jgi:hypothetical protein
MGPKQVTSHCRPANLALGLFWGAMRPIELVAVTAGGAARR